MKAIGRSRRWWLGVVALIASGCAAQSENLDDRDWTVDHGFEADDAKLRDVETLFGEAESDVDHFNATPRGVRHDLALGEGATPDTRCTCLDVVVGKPSDRRFAWAAERPTISPETLVVAVRTEGSECSGDKPRRPSIQAVDVQGEDVIIVVEELGGERPQALGAIVKKPGPDGHLWVRSRKVRNKALPYARSGDPQRDMCRIATKRGEHHLRGLSTRER